MPVTRRTQAFGAHPHTLSRIGTEHRVHRPLAVGAPIVRARRSPSCPDLGVRVAEGVAMTDAEITGDLMKGLLIKGVEVK